MQFSLRQLAALTCAVALFFAAFRLVDAIVAIVALTASAAVAGASLDGTVFRLGTVRAAIVGVIAVWVALIILTIIMVNAHHT